MLSRTEALHAILHQPLDYLHPGRGSVPQLFDCPQARNVLNQSLLQRLALGCPNQQQSEMTLWADMWVKHWRYLPQVARLMGAQLRWPDLARGGRLRELDSSVRAFARIDLGYRASVGLNVKYELESSLSALGLGGLLAWHAHVPQTLMRRLPLQFSPEVVELQQAWPAQAPHSSLFFLAVQHARLHQNSG
ncbi:MULTISPECIES: hypothetical protein [Pseudomonas]|jgi:type III secretion system OrgA/MxiK family protein|uniref:hypothetical protein n=1 Tax=Pseudomonas TaxID=286 RepID=UPI001C0A8B6D|nr:MULTISPECIES: hypothetical protein [Pseudomonas]MCK3838835.1 hypothetical protein [Pseudomonas sp. NCIMB 10586]VCU67896.1 type III secretion system protein [Pseudomonas synxantha]